MSVRIAQVTPVLRIFDVGVAKSFYCDYLGCSVDWQSADGSSGPVYMQVSRGPLVLHLSSHHGDGTPGGVVLIEVTGIKELQDELHAKDYRFMNPGIEPGPVENMVSMELIDPFSNLVRFFQWGGT
jgi:Glyoxalase superfamily protein